MGGHVLHEWTHAINDSVGVVDGLPEEEVTTKSALGWCAFIRANVQAFADWLQLLLQGGRCPSRPGELMGKTARESK